MFDWSESKVDFNNTENTSMYKEPVVFCRLMAVHDLGTQELTSTDGRKFKIVHLIQSYNYTTRDEGLLSWESYLMGNVSVYRNFHYYNGEKTRGLLLGEE